MKTVLVIDDQPAVRDALRLLFEIHDIPCLTASVPEEALALARTAGVGAVVQDMNFEPGETSGDQGIALFRALRAARPELPILLITAWTALETAVQMVKEGATDYLAKPWDDDKLVETVRELLRGQEPAAAAGEAAGEALGERHDLCGLVFASDATRKVVSLALHVAPSSVPVLVTGPNGSGKEKLADIVHANSRRRRGPFVKVNVGAIPIELMEAELFGAEAGAYTGRRDRRIGRFEVADGGTLFLDEIDSLSLAGQVKLLRALESGEFSRLGSSQTRTVDVRVLAATNADLAREIAEGRFREDLYFRVNVVELRLPGLAERPRDIPPLAEHFLSLFAADRGGAPRRLGAEALQALLDYRWSGNVRELRNRLQRADLLAAGEVITPADLDLAPAALAGARLPEPPAIPASAELDAAEQAEKKHVEQALIAAGGIVARAADELGVSRQALYRKMARLGIVLERRPSSG